MNKEMFTILTTEIGWVVAVSGLLVCGFKQNIVWLRWELL